MSNSSSFRKFAFDGTRPRSPFLNNVVSPVVNSTPGLLVSNSCQVGTPKVDGLSGGSKVRVPNALQASQVNVTPFDMDLIHMAHKALTCKQT